MSRVPGRNDILTSLSHTVSRVCFTRSLGWGNCLSLAGLLLAGHSSLALAPYSSGEMSLRRLRDAEPEALQLRNGTLRGDLSFWRRVHAPMFILPSSKFSIMGIHKSFPYHDAPPLFSFALLPPSFFIQFCYSTIFPVLISL